MEEVPAPLINENSILVQVSFSLISSGTERTSVFRTEKSIIQKAIQEPEKVQKAWDTLKTEGISKTIDKIRGNAETSHPLGYSCAGKVIEVGTKISDIKIGDEVACAGAGYANHAEIVCIPRNLAVKVPEKLDMRNASSVTLGAIALQGVRRANCNLGDVVAVIGLGLIGQITTQILKAAGCHVIGIDLDGSRVELAKSLGLDYGVNSNQEDPVATALRYTSGLGVDVAIITAATERDELVQQAMELTRKKGRVVVVGDVGLHLKREPFYKKELDFAISCSYGPGRYDDSYEEKGIDYPYAYVRWTENRNMQEYLRMLAERKINFEPLISQQYSIGEALLAYQQLQESPRRPLGILLEYPETKEIQSQLQKLSIKVDVQPKAIKKEGLINVAVIGAGNFAKGVHLPNLQKLSQFYNIYAIVSGRGSNAKETAHRFRAQYCTTDYKEVLKDKSVDMVLIATRHNLHARMAIDAAKAGKAIFLEKPMALNKEELNELIQTLRETKVPLLVGFNRRFSPYCQKIKEVVENRINPMIINYQMNAGIIQKEHWIHTEEGGGRNIGEACHIYDLFNFFTESKVKSISASAIDPKTEQYVKNENFITTIKYNDGSLCNLFYTALGSKDYPKEEMDIYVDGKVIHLNDYKDLEIFGARGCGLKTKTQDKGQFKELQEFARSIKEGNGYSIPLWQLIQATEIGFEVEKRLITG